MSAPSMISTVTTQSVTTAVTTMKYTRQISVNSKAGSSMNQKRIGEAV